MNKLLHTPLGRLRLLAYLEGTSLLVLVFIAVPLKHFAHMPALVGMLGPLHGLLFLWFVMNTLSTAVEQRWHFRQTTTKVLLACLIPFGTFYIDRHVLRPLQTKLPELGE